MEENATNFDEFFGAFDADDGYQTDSETATEEMSEGTQEEKTQSDENGSESQGEATEETESEESGENEQSDGDKKEGAEASQEPEMFTIKVNKEERQVTREELLTLAQKGADYDRVKQQAEKGKTDNQALTEQLAQTKKAYDVLTSIAKDSGVDVPTLLDTFRVRQIMDKENLSEKEATERLGRLKAEEKLNELQTAKEKKSPEQERQERAERELKEFQKNFPDVDIKDLPVEQMAEDIAAGMTMTQAYLKQENRKQQAEIEKLNAQLKAKEQNNKNRLSSPGSASDSGARKTKDQFDDFFAAFG